MPILCFLVSNPSSIINFGDFFDLRGTYYHFEKQIVINAGGI